MSAWPFFLAACVFAYLAYDARKLAVPSQTVPYQIEAKGRGESVDGVPLQEQAVRKRWHSFRGVGEGSHATWLWAILALACLFGAVLDLTQ
jgi:hypothetical protein